MEVGRRKKEEAIKSIVSAINNVLTVLAVAIYQFRLHRNDGEWGVGSGEWGNVELLTLTPSFPCNRKRYYVTGT